MSEEWRAGLRASRLGRREPRTAVRAKPGTPRSSGSVVRLADGVGQSRTPSATPRPPTLDKEDLTLAYRDVDATRRAGSNAALLAEGTATFIPLQAVCQATGVAISRIRRLEHRTRG